MITYRKIKTKNILMKIKLYAEESFKTTVRRGSLEIDTDNYPEVQGMTEGEISNYIDGHAYDMKPVNPDVYSSLGEELSDQDVEYDDINDDDIEFYIEQIV